MAILTAGITVWLYGEGGRNTILPVKAGVFIAEGALVAQINGACVPASTAGAGPAIGVATHDMTGGVADGTKRINVMRDCEFIFPAGAAAPTDFTPMNTPLYVEDDHTVGTGGLGATQQFAGLFAGIEDDGRVRIFVGERPADATATTGTPIGNVASITVQRQSRITRYNVATLSQNITITLGTTGAVQGDVIRIVRTDVNAFTLAVVNGGAGAGTLATIVATKPGFVEAIFDGTNWLYNGSSAT